MVSGLLAGEEPLPTLEHNANAVAIQPKPWQIVTA